MRRWLWLFVALAGNACVDLTRPPQLEHPPDADLAPDAAGGSRDVARDLAMPDHGPGTGGAGLDVAPPADLPDASVEPDLPLPADAALVPDLAPPADQARLPADAPPLPADAAPSPPDAAPSTPDAAPPADLAPEAGAPPLVIDDFQSTGPINRNSLASDVTWDHETCNRVNGEMVCSYAGGPYHDFIETLAGWCAYDVSKYRKLRFRLRTSVAGEQVEIFAGRSATGGCSQTLVSLGTITTTSTMTTYELDLSAVTASSKWLVAFEFDPMSTNATQFIYDDLQLLP
jgi:hypothetical protein